MSESNFQEGSNSSNSEIQTSSEPILNPSELLEEVEGPEILGSQVCDICVGDNLLKNVGIRTCARCRNPFCIHFSCKVDPLTYCVSCMSQIELTRSVVTKTIEHYDEVTDTLRTYTRRAREIKLSGDDWMFAQRRVKDLSDDELDMVVEYHRQYLQLLCDDAERRRMEKAHRNANVKFVIPSAQVTSTTVTTTKKVSTVKLDKQKEQAAALLAQLLSQPGGADMAALLAKLKK